MGEIPFDKMIADAIEEFGLEELAENVLDIGKGRLKRYADGTSRPMPIIRNYCRREIAQMRLDSLYAKV